MNIGIKVEGLRELDLALSEMSKATQRGILTRALMEQGRILERKARALAPKDAGNLAEGITTTTLKPPGYHDAGKAAYAESLSSGGSKGEAVAALRAARRADPNSFAEVFVGPGRHPQAITQEFGTWFHPAQPYLRPAWDATKDQILAGLRDAIKFEVFAALERTAKKRAR